MLAALRRFRLVVALGAAFLFAVLASCGTDGPTVPDGSAPSSPFMPTTPQVRLAVHLDTLYIGTGRTYTATVVDAKGATVSGVAVGWQTLTPTLAKVPSAGRVEALADNGTALIRVYVAEGSADTLQIVLQPVPLPTMTALRLVPDSTTLSYGLSQLLGVEGRYSDSTSKPVASGLVLTNLTPTLLSFAGNTVTALADTGRGLIEARVGTLRDTAVVRLRAASPTTPVALTLDRQIDTLGRGQSRTLRAAVTLADGSVGMPSAVSWTSSDASLATVSSSGVVSAQSDAGTVLVIASAMRAVDTTVVTLRAAVPKSMALAMSATSVSISSTFTGTVTLTAMNGLPMPVTGITWTVRTPAVATLIASSGGQATFATAAAGMTWLIAQLGPLADSAQVTVMADPVGSLTITPTTMTLPAGQSEPLTVTARSSAGALLSGRLVIYTSSDPAIATVSSAGVVTGVSSGGPVVITATSEGVSATASVTVVMEVATVTLNTATLALVEGNTSVLTATLKGASGTTLTGRTVMWTSSNFTVASVSSSGVVTGNAAGGPVTITATSEGKTATASVTVSAASVGSLTIAPTTMTLTPSQSGPLTATVRSTSGAVLTGRIVTYASSNAAIAAVSSAGIVTGASVGGPITITASCEGKTATASVTVTTETVATVTLAPSTLTLEVGSTSAIVATLRSASGAVLTGRTVAWTSSDASVASVNAAGIVTAVAPGGPVTVGATSEGRSATVTVTVIPEVVATVTLNTATLALVEGSSSLLTATLKGASGTTLTGRTVVWTSANATVAPVNSWGAVKANAAGGPVTITATSEGKTATASVTVTAAVIGSVTITPVTVTLRAGQFGQLTVTVRSTSGAVLTGRTVTYVSSNAAVAAVSTSGQVTGLSAGGPVTITATSGGMSAQASVTVTASALALSPEAVTLVVGDTWPMAVRHQASAVAALLPPTSATWTATSSVITLGAALPDFGRQVIGVTPGSSYVRVTANGATDSIRVTVVAPNAALMPVDVQLIGTYSSLWTNAIAAAGVRWARVFTAPLPLATVTMRADECQFGIPAATVTTTGVRIYVLTDTTDGPGGTLASAGPCYLRSGALTAIVGVVIIDKSDLASLEQGSYQRMVDLITHEMGHIFGIGTVWYDAAFTTGLRGTDPRYLGTKGKQAYADLGYFDAGFGIPIENTGGGGTRDAHWSYATFGRELMHGWLSAAGNNRMSSMTIQALADFGYSVNVGRAETYLAFGSWTPAGLRADLQSDDTRIDVGNDIWQPKWGRPRLVP